MRFRLRWVVLGVVLLGFGLCGREARRVYRIVRVVPEQPIPAPTADPASQRELALGQVIGTRTPAGAHAWHGLPFALPPLGELRWKAPRPAASWAGVRQALARTPMCPQPKQSESQSGIVGAEGQEDCLYLDIYAPKMTAAEAAKQRLPVMLWIHGGANVAGSAAQTEASLLAVRHKVVVVATNYRLGPLGWFSHPALAAAVAKKSTADEGAAGAASAGTEGVQSGELAASAADRSGNYGTLDLIQALRFVHDNIASFGGDPQLVTVFGVSAGGANILSLLLAPDAKGLFQRAISQSAPIYSYSVEQAQAYTEAGGLEASSAEVLARLLVAAGRAPDRAAAKALATSMEPAETASFLRAQTPEALLRATLLARPPGDDRPPEFPTVVRDGTVLPLETPLQLFARGDFERVPLLIGTNRDEMKSFMAGNPELVERRSSGYVRIKDAERYALLAEYRSEAWRAGTVNAIAPLIHKLGGPSVFSYRFDWDEQPTLLMLNLSLLLGAGHGLETPFVFGTFDTRGRSRFAFTEDNREGREALSSAMMSYWAELAVHGTPGRGRDGKLPEWKPWSDGDKFLALDTKQGGGIRMQRDSTTVPELLARLAHDPRVPNLREKCRVLFFLTQRGRSVPKESYATTPGIDCSNLPPEQYPWEAPSNAKPSEKRSSM